LRSAVGALILVALSASAAAQPSTDPLPPDRGTNSDTKIPVGSTGTEVLGAEGQGTTSSAAPIPLDQPIDPNTYKCGPGDAFEINFWGQQNFRLKVSADLEGRVFISKVGFVTVSGKTLTEVRSLIRKKVGANYPGLQFDVTLVNPRMFVVHVAGFVKQPGGFAVHPLERVSSVLARAGGPTGSKRRIAIRHRNGVTENADLILYELTGDTKFNPFLLDGDVVKVPSPGVVVSISGAVQRTGSFELVANKDLNELLELVGGLTSDVARELPIRVTRRNASQREEFRELPFANGVPTNEALKDDDIVLVRSVAEFQRSVLLIGAVVGTDPVDAATSSKRLPFIEGDSVRTLIERAGGIRTAGDLKRSYIYRPATSDQKAVADESKPRRIDNSKSLIPIDLDALLVRRDFSADKAVQMGDTIVVPSMRYGVLVEGAVVRPGFYGYNPLFGVPEYIAHAGGRTRMARDMDEVRIVNPDGKSRTFAKNLQLSPGDAIVVPERNFSRAEIVQIVIAGAGLVLSGVAITLAATR
jgi:polysaccharide biosynthesis/export protein